MYILTHTYLHKIILYIHRNIVIQASMPIFAILVSGELVMVMNIPKQTRMYPMKLPEPPEKWRDDAPNLVLLTMVPSQ